jgi:hypothetical protein
MAIDYEAIGIVLGFTAIGVYSLAEAIYCYQLGRKPLAERAAAKAIGPFSMYDIDVAQRTLKDSKTDLEQKVSECD